MVLFWSATGDFVRAQTTNIPIQRAYLKPSNTEALDYFGTSVAISGDTIVVGTGGNTGEFPEAGEDGGSPGVNGNPLDNSVLNAGAAYVFVRSGTSWVQQAYLKSPHPRTNDYFGSQVAISGDTVAVASYRDDGPDGSLTNAGAVFIYVREGSNWVYQATIRLPDAQTNDLFGVGISLSGDALLVSSPDITRYTQCQAGEAYPGPRMGASFIFRRMGTSWVFEASLDFPCDQNSPWVIGPVSIDGDTVAVGNFLEGSDAVGINGSTSTNEVTFSGAVYLYRRQGTNWILEAHLKAHNPAANDFFGNFLDLDGNTLAVAAPGKKHGPASNDRRGAAYVFTRENEVWRQVAYLTLTNGPFSMLGYGVASSSNRLAVTLDSYPADDVVYFEKEGTNWVQKGILQSQFAPPPQQQQSIHFGGSLDLFGSTLVIGADREDSSATGINGNQYDQSAFNAGAAFVFEQEIPPLLPRLQLTLNQKTIRLSWPIGSSNQLLEQAGDLFMPSTWQTIAPPYSSNAVEMFHSVPATNRQQFFRLRGNLQGSREGGKF